MQGGAERTSGSVLNRSDDREERQGTDGQQAETSEPTAEPQLGQEAFSAAASAAPAVEDRPEEPAPYPPEAPARRRRLHCPPPIFLIGRTRRRRRRDHSRACRKPRGHVHARGGSV